MTNPHLKHKQLYNKVSVEQLHLSFIFYNCIWDVVGSNLYRDTVYPD
jgi:hypothetical protein